MLFNSFSFLLFYPIVTTIFFITPHAFRWLILLLASCYFYMYFIPIYIIILFFTILVDYFVGIWLEKSSTKYKKKILIISLLINIGILCVFKYYNFFVDNINSLSLQAGVNYYLPLLKIALPVGLSFHTFQAMSYTIEVYRGRQKAEKHFGIYALYVMFYPQLVAGPIERPQNILHQFHEKKKFNYANFNKGLSLMLWGIFKKVVIADRLDTFTSIVFENPHSQTAETLLLGVIFFSIQIYCDFSGYSDVALGCAKTMGYDLMLNFNRPYFAKSIVEFWRRWHISLSTWFRDYLYIPLGGNRNGKAKWIINVFIVFLISGFWHGANWTFIIWGSLHGFFNTINLLYKHLITITKYKKIFNIFTYNTVAIPLTIICVVLAWIFFRAASVSDAFYILKKIVFNLGTGNLISKTGSFYLYSFFAIAILFMKEWKDELNIKIYGLSSKKYVIRLASILFLIFAICLLGVFNSTQFIYFQF